MLATLGDVVVLTRANNRAGIDVALAALPEHRRPRFVYVDLPDWARWWKRGQRGIRLYYLLWQIAALGAARRLSRAERFDLFWHLTFANAWIGTLASLAGRPFVYGPVGGGTAAPRRLLPSFGWGGFAYETARSLIRITARYLNPLARLGWATAELVLVQNPETLAWLPARARRRAVVFPNATLEPQAIASGAPRRGRRVVYAGRLLAWKGVALALHALAATDDWTLTVCGDGPDRARLTSLARRLGLSDRVLFTGWLPRSEVLALMRDHADVFLLPSLHDEAPLAVVDALGCGLPVVCFSIGGPPVLAGRAATVVSAAGSVGDVVARLALALRGSHPESAVAIDRARELTVDARASQLFEVLVAAKILRGVSEWVAA